MKTNTEETGIVPIMINAASQAKIEVLSLRRNISVLEGSGGNIAVLTGRDGKLLIDGGSQFPDRGLRRPSTA